MLHYKVYQNKSKGNKAYGKWFARAAVNQTIDLEQLAEHMANHNTPYSKGAIFGVLTEMVNCIRELVLDGNAVKIPNLAIFSAGLKTKGADNLNDFNVATNVLSAHLRARPCGDFTRAELTAAARVQEAAQGCKRLVSTIVGKKPRKAITRVPEQAKTCLLQVGGVVTTPRG